MLRYRLRLLLNSAVSTLPKTALRGFFKTFTMRPELAEAAGFHVHPCRFDSPFPLMGEIDWPALGKPRALSQIDFRLQSARDLLRQISPFARELDPIPAEQS